MRPSYMQILTQNGVPEFHLMAEDLYSYIVN